MTNYTLRGFKLCMCDVNKGKVFAVGSCNYEMVLCVIRVFNPSEKERKKQPTKDVKNVYKRKPKYSKHDFFLHSPLEFCISD